MTKLIDLLVALTISEEEMYPLIQAHVWAKIGREKDLLRRVLGSFIRMGITTGLGSRKVEVLADTVVTLEQGTEGLVATEVIKKLLKVCSTVMSLKSGRAAWHCCKNSRLPLMWFNTIIMWLINMVNKL